MPPKDKNPEKNSSGTTSSPATSEKKKKDKKSSGNTSATTTSSATCDDCLNRFESTIQLFTVDADLQHRETLICFNSHHQVDSFMDAMI
ncbi:hypothetical protein L1987_00371 [Smallanthus sonchifolius]|uniref:Uncharacterized protein n=1 Tax=Smallanthus sonchifolius TaxID=185202 RepID=A0ACB9K2B3_9ASTR|nr:hypothetical protein L1987_00371 [Smallanthus sonchifolius]